MTPLRFLLLASLTASSVLLTSCSSSSDLPTSAYAIQYSVSITGSASVSQIQYTASDGTTTTVNTPTLPFTAASARTSGETASLVVTGAANGSDSIVASIADDPALVTTPTTYASSSCTGQASCNISISNNF